MSSPFGTLRGSLFAPVQPPTAAGPSRAPTTAFTSKVPYPILGPNATETDRLALAAAFMLAGTSTTGTLLEWKSYLAGYTVLVTPALAGMLPQATYTRIVIPETQMATIRSAYRDFFSILHDTDIAPTLEQKRAYANRGFPAGIPAPNVDLPWEEAYGEIDPKVVACHFAIVLFLAGKRIDGTDHTPITVKRPEALRSKAHFYDVIGFLDGSLRLSDHSHSIINSAWAESSALRAKCFTEYSQFAHMETDIIQDLIYTTMHLLKYSGMQHARITYGFLQAYPWVVEMPTLRAAVATYMESVQAASKYPEHVQPYIKLIYADKAGLFPRNELEPLVECALDVAKKTTPTLQEFYTSDNYASVVDAFNRERQKRESTQTATHDTQEGIGETEDIEEA